MLFVAALTLLVLAAWAGVAIWCRARPSEDASGEPIRSRRRCGQWSARSRCRRGRGVSPVRAQQRRQGLSSPGADVAPKTQITMPELFPVLPPWRWLIGCALDSGSTVTRAPSAQADAAAHPLGTAHRFSLRPLT
jgi:hypothetical protein